MKEHSHNLTISAFLQEKPMRPPAPSLLELISQPALLLVRSFTGNPRLTWLKTLKFCQASDTDCRSVIWKVLPSSQSASKKPGPRSELRPAFPSRKAKAGSLRTVPMGTYAVGLKPVPRGTLAFGLPIWKALSV